MTWIYLKDRTVGSLSSVCESITSYSSKAEDCIVPNPPEFGVDEILHGILPFCCCIAIRDRDGNVIEDVVFALLGLSSSLVSVGESTEIGFDTHCFCGHFNDHLQFASNMKYDFLITLSIILSFLTFVKWPGDIEIRQSFSVFHGLPGK